MSLFEKLNNKRYSLQEKKNPKKKYVPPSEFQYSSSAKDAAEIGGKESKGASAIIDPSQTEFGKGKNRGNNSSQIPMGGEFAKGKKIRKTRSDSGTTRGKRKIKGSNNPNQGNIFDQKPKNKTPLKRGFENVTGENLQGKDIPKTRKDLEAKRKFYEIDKKGNISKRGVERYAREIYRTNLPLTKKQLDKAKQFAVGGKKIKDSTGKVVGTTTGKYGGRLRDKRKPSQKTLDAIKNIDNRPPDGRTIRKKKTTPKVETPKVETPKVETPKVETPPKTQTAKQFDGKSFDDFIKDAKKKNKAAQQSIKNIKVDPVTKFGSKVSVGNQIPFVQPGKKRIPNPERVKKIKDYRSMLKSQPKYLRNISKFSRKNPRLRGAAVVLGTLGAIAGINKLATSGTKKPTPVVPLTKKDVVPLTANLNLSKGNRPTFTPTKPKNT